MTDFKSSIKNMFKDERYWEGIAVGAVTTLFGEWVATTASSALVNMGVIQPGRQSNAFQGVIDLLSSWRDYALFKSSGYEELGIISSAVEAIFGIYKIIEALVGTNPYTYVSQKASLVGGFGMATARPYTPPVVASPTAAPPAQPAPAAQPTMGGLPIKAQIL
jgi:hypothetical protein